MRDGLSIRPMTGEDIPAACTLSDEAGWRSRTAFYELVLRLPTCRPLLGEVGSEVVATGVATISGPVGWVGTIVVAKAHRGRGYGREMTVAVSDVLRAAGCESLALIATALGRPVYEKLGFDVDTYYHLMEAERPEQAPEPPIGMRVRSLTPGDLPAVLALDASATGEDRSAVLEALAAPGGGWLLESLAPLGELRGFMIPSDRGYAAIVAPAFDDGRYLVELHRFVSGATRHARAGIPHVHGPALHALEGGGWHETWLAPRMVLGKRIPWRPGWIWGQINFAMG